MLCESCADQLRRTLSQDSHANFVRGLVFGIGAAIAGLIFYAGFTIATGFYIGYIAFAVGWLIAKAIMIGSKGVGGRRYQLAAVLLTYAAVSLAAIPIALWSSPSRESGDGSAQTRQQKPADAPQDEAQPEGQTKHRGSLASALLSLLFIGLASPFIELQDPLHGLIGLVILYIGLQIAWKMTRATAAGGVEGPYENATAARV